MTQKVSFDKKEHQKVASQTLGFKRKRSDSEPDSDEDYTEPPRKRQKTSSGSQASDQKSAGRN